MCLCVCACVCLCLFFCCMFPFLSLVLLLKTALACAHVRVTRALSHQATLEVQWRCSPCTVCSPRLYSCQVRPVLLAPFRRSLLITNITKIRQYCGPLSCYACECVCVCVYHMNTHSTLVVDSFVYLLLEGKLVYKEFTGITNR